MVAISRGTQKKKEAKCAWINIRQQQVKQEKKRSAEYSKSEKHLNSLRHCKSASEKGV